MLRRPAKWKFLKSILLIWMFSMQINVSTTTSIQPLGSILFDDHGYPKKCFMQNDIALLATRLKLQKLLPDNIEMMSDDGILALIKYFYGINDLIDHMNENEAHQLVEKCFYDMLGGYLKHIILPITKFSFYAGNASLSVATNVFSLYERCKEVLNTNGNSWSDPITDFSQFSINIFPLNIPKSFDEDAMKACSNLALNQNDDDNEEDMLVPLPKIETSGDENLSTIWLPLKRKHIFNIQSKTSAFILFRYYVMVTQCYRYQNINQSIFNRKLKFWIFENVIPYLDDDQIYPAFGAVLRIMETIRDQNDLRYEGNKQKKPKKYREDVIDFIHSDVKDKFFDENERNIYWWIYALLAAATLTFIIIFMIFICCRFCCRRKKDENNESLTKKISNVLKRNTHTPEYDEFYAYKKVPSDDPQKNRKGIRFENEKSQKSGFMRKFKPKKSAEKFKLPNLNGSDTEEEVVLHEFKKSPFPSSASSLNSIRPKQKLSGDTDEIAEMASQNLTKSAQKQAGFLRRMRSKSPLKKSKNMFDDT